MYGTQTRFLRFPQHSSFENDVKCMVLKLVLCQDLEQIKMGVVIVLRLLQII